MLTAQLLWNLWNIMQLAFTNGFPEDVLKLNWPFCNPARLRLSHFPLLHLKFSIIRCIIATSLRTARTNPHYNHTLPASEQIDC